MGEAIERLPSGPPVVLVGHSGAGVLLPSIARASSRRVAGYIFVDCDIPRDGLSRLDLIPPDDSPQFAAGASGGFLPVWTEDDLREAIPDDEMRRRFVSELEPLPVAVYQEPVPIFDGWPDAPCGYIRLGEAYPASVERARSEHWAYTELRGGHFHMLSAPAEVAQALLNIAGRMGIDFGSGEE